MNLRTKWTIALLAVVFIISISYVINAQINPGNNVNIVINCQPNQLLWGFSCVGNEHPNYTFSYYQQGNVLKYRFKVYLNGGSAIVSFGGNVSALSPQPVNTVLASFVAQVQQEVAANHQATTTPPPAFSGGGSIT